MSDQKPNQEVSEATIYPPNVMEGNSRLDVIDPESAGGNLSGLFRERVSRSASKIAYQEYDEGNDTWHQYSWTQMRDEVARWQAVLTREGLQPGDRVALRLRNCRHWVIFDQAALGLGLVVVPLYVDDRADNVAYILEHTNTRILLVGQLENWTEMSNCEEDLSAIRRVLVMGDGVSEEQGRVVSVDDWLPADSESHELITADVDQQALASIVYTSGTTGRPKGVMLTHGNILLNAWYGLHSHAIYPNDVFLSFLPLSHTLERTVGYYIPMTAGSEVAYTRSIPQLVDDLQIIRPTTLISVPRIFERAYKGIHEKLDEGSGLKKKLFNLAIEIGWHRFEYAQGRASWHPKLLLWPLLDKLVATKVKQRFGGRLRGAVSGGAPLPAHVGKLFCSLGIPIMQGYGLTETSPSLSISTLNNNIPWSIGMPLHKAELRIGDDSELLARSPSVMKGYWRNEEATQEVLDDDGWFHTGDCARIEKDGFIYITGRIKEILVLSNGEKVPPADMETAICEDALFEQCIVLGEAQPFLSAIAVLNLDRWQSVAKSSGIDHSDPDALSSESVEQLLKKRIASQLESFPGYAQIHRVTATLEPWDVANGLLTPTLKLKRPKIKEHFEQAISRMYEGH